jgi:hypothetical protein
MNALQRQISRDSHHLCGRDCGSSAPQLMDKINGVITIRVGLRQLEATTTALCKRLVGHVLPDARPVAMTNDFSQRSVLRCLDLAIGCTRILRVAANVVRARRNRIADNDAFAYALWVRDSVRSATYVGLKKTRNTAPAKKISRLAASSGVLDPAPLAT